MATQANLVIEHLRRFVFLRDKVHLADEQLLDDFISRRDNVAFEVLVRRHAAMVMGVCRRVLASHHDAEDAFQATFLVLARKAAALAARGLVANWLYGVAYNTALKAKAAAAKRRVREREAADMPKPDAAAPGPWQDLQALLDQELSRLPDKYRAAIVLCDLEGKSRKEAALQIGCPEGTVASRLVRGRTLLAKRLTQRGAALSAAALAGEMTLPIASASVPTSLITTTSNAAILYAAGHAVTDVVSSQVAALAEGVLKAMVLTKFKTMTLAALLLGLIAFGGGGWLTRSTTAAQVEQKGIVKPADKPEQPGLAAMSAPPRRGLTPEENLQLLMAGMKKERNAVVSGQARAVGKQFRLDTQDKSRDFDGDLELTIAFERDGRFRFYRTGPGWVSDMDTAVEDSNKPGQWITQTKPGIVSTKFYKNNERTGFWHTYGSGSVITLSSADEKPHSLVEYFDVKAIGLYDGLKLYHGKSFNGLVDELFGKRQADSFRVVELKDGIWEIVLFSKQSLTSVLPLATETEIEFVYQIDTANGFTPIRFVNRERSLRSFWSWITKQESTSQWKLQNNSWVPVRYEFSQGEWPGRAKGGFSFDLEWQNVNKELDPALFDCEAFNLPDRRVLDVANGQISIVREGLRPEQDVSPEQDVGGQCSAPENVALWKQMSFIVPLLLSVLGAFVGWRVYSRTKRR
jgi:RNA polymerase sigma factor (sigma-70 family)